MRGPMRSASSALAALLVACVAPLALGQTAPAGAPPGQGSPAAAAPPAASPPSTAPAAPGDAPPKPPSIDVDDPLLAPVPAPAHTFNGFKEVLTLLSNESLTLRIAQQDIQRAEGARRAALAATLPQLTGRADASNQLLRCTPGDITASGEPCRDLAAFGQAVERFGAGLTLSVSLSPRSWYAVGTNDKVVEASKLRVEDARRTAITAAANAIVAVVTAERVAEINRVGLRAALQRLELTKRRKRLGSGTDLDIVRAEQDAASARSQIVTGDENLRRSRESLGALFGKADAYGVPTTFTLNDIEPALKAACAPAKADERPDVLAAKTDVKVAERQVTDVKLAFSPTVDLSSTLSANNFVSGVSGDNATWSISAVLSVPIWDGGARYGQLKTQNANLEAARTRVEQATVTATLESTQAQRAITVAEQAKSVSEKSRDLARETARLSQVAFESGSGTSLDLVDSGRVLRQAELDLALKELEIVRAKIAALLALSACKL